MGSRRLTVAQAAKYLSTSESSIHHKVNRNSIPHEKDESTGRVFILIDELEHEGLTEDNHRYSSSEPSNTERLIDTLTRQLETTQESLEQERAANRENRRLLAAALERIPAIEPPDTPSEPRESPETASEEPYSTHHAPPMPGTPVSDAQRKRSWWRAFFGLD